jgi:hypothetical protein
MLNGNEQIDPGDLDAGIERALDFLERSQLPTGEFKVYMSTDELRQDSVVDSSPFPTALIAYSLGFSDSPKAQAMLERMVQFFLGEMEGPGLWRYWTRKHQYHDTIPPDLDDIACVSAVLRQHGIAFPTNRNLVMANRNRQGLFYTWLTPRWPMPVEFAYWRVVFRQWLHPFKHYYFWKLNESAASDVDCVVNANVLFYAGQSSQTQAVIDYLIDVVRRGEEGCCDKWHLNRFTFYYTLSRNFYAGVQAFAVVRDEIVSKIMAAIENGSLGDNAMETALAICAMLNWDSLVPELRAAVRFLLTTQRTTGDWPRTVLYYGGPKKYYGWGSEELTTGFCLEALMRYRKALRLSDKL